MERAPRNTSRRGSNRNEKLVKVLNLYAGIGGNRKLWTDCDVTAVEIVSEVGDIYKEFFPKDKVIIGDAHEYLLEHFQEYDFIWASPPCTTHTRINKNFGFIRYADMRLYQEIILLQNWFKGKYCIENVIPYYQPLIPAQQYHRHLFWCNFKIRTTGKGNPPKQIKIKAQKGTKQKPWIQNDDIDYLADQLGMNRIKKRIYLNGNHSPGQLFRNAVHPEVGLMIFNLARGIIIDNNKEQTKLEL